MGLHTGITARATFSQPGGFMSYAASGEVAYAGITSRDAVVDRTAAVFRVGVSRRSGYSIDRAVSASAPGVNGTLTGLTLESTARGNESVTVTGASGATYAGSVPCTVADTLVSWVAGSLAAHVVSSFAALLARPANLGVFTTQNHAAASYVRNASCWAFGFDWTGCSPWNSEGTTVNAGTLLARDVVVCADHAGYGWDVGTVGRFVEANGTVHERTVIAAGPVDFTDTWIARLDSPLPAAIKHYKVLPSNWRNRLPNWSLGIPTLAFDQEEKITARMGYGMHTYLANLFSHVPYGYPNNIAHTENLIGGDSGNPNFILISGEPVLIGCHYTAGGCPMLADGIAPINAAITALGSSYQIETVNLSAFPSY